MRLEGVVSNGVIVPDPSSAPLADGTRVQFTPVTGMGWWNRPDGAEELRPPSLAGQLVRANRPNP